MKTSLLLILLGALIQQQETRSHGGRKISNINGIPDGLQRPGRGRWCLKWCPEGEESDENEDNAGGPISVNNPYESYPRIYGGYEELDMEEPAQTPYGGQNENSYVNPFMTPTVMLRRLGAQPFGITGGAGQLQSPDGIGDFDEDYDEDMARWGPDQNDEDDTDNELDEMMLYGSAGEHLGERYGMPYGIADGRVTSGLFSDIRYGRKPDRIIEASPYYGTPAVGAGSGFVERIPYGQGIASEEELDEPFISRTYDPDDGELFGSDPYSIASAGLQGNSDEPQPGDQEHETSDRAAAKRGRRFRVNLMDKLGYYRNGTHKRRDGRTDSAIDSQVGHENLLKGKPRIRSGEVENEILVGGSDREGLERKLIQRRPLKTVTRRGHGDNILAEVSRHDIERRNTAAKPKTPEVSIELSSEEQDQENDDEEHEEYTPKKKYQEEFGREKVREAKVLEGATDTRKPEHGAAKPLRKDPGLDSTQKRSPMKTEYSQPALQEPPSVLSGVADLVAAALKPLLPPRGINTIKQAGDHTNSTPRRQEQENYRRGDRGKNEAGNSSKQNQKELKQTRPHEEENTESKNIDEIPDLFDKAVDLVHFVVGGLK